MAGNQGSGRMWGRGSGPGRHRKCASSRRGTLMVEGARSRRGTLMVEGARSRRGTLMVEGARSRRGTLMVEGALIFPLVLLAVFSVLYIALFLFSETVIQAEVHMAAREGAGKMAGTVYKGRWAEVECQTGEQGLYFRGAEYDEIAEQVEAAVRTAVESAPLTLEIVAAEGLWEYGLLQPQFILAAEAEGERKWLLEKGRRRWFEGRAAFPAEAALIRNADWVAEQL